MTDVVSLNAARADRTNDNTVISPLECIEDAANDLRTGKRVCDKLLVLTLDTGDDGKAYRVGFYASHLSASEALALSENAKLYFAGMLGFGA